MGKSNYTVLWRQKKQGVGMQYYIKTTKTRLYTKAILDEARQPISSYAHLHYVITCIEIHGESSTKHDEVMNKNNAVYLDEQTI